MPEDEDYEWVACLLIEADSFEKAKEWGDKLSINYCGRNSENEFVKSNVELYTKSDLSNLPFIKYGEEALDSKIGW